MPGYAARAEFRRRDRDSRWVLAGVWIDTVSFYPAEPGVDPVRSRLSAPGLVGWIELLPIIAPDEPTAGLAALHAARVGWPKAVDRNVPHP